MPDNDTPKVTKESKTSKKSTPKESEFDVGDTIDLTPKKDKKAEKKDDKKDDKKDKGTDQLGLF